MIVFDLDGTLADMTHRAPMIAHRPRMDAAQWDLFFAAAVNDTPIVPMVDLFAMLRPLTELQIWTGRPERIRRATEDWLTEHLFLNRRWVSKSARTSSKYNPIVPNPWHIPLRMRPDADHRPDAELKQEWLAALAAPPTMVFEDRERVVDMWRRNGVVCAQVAKGDY